MSLDVSTENFDILKNAGTDLMSTLNNTTLSGSTFSLLQNEMNSLVTLISAMTMLVMMFSVGIFNCSLMPNKHSLSMLLYTFLSLVVAMISYMIIGHSMLSANQNNGNLFIFNFNNLYVPNILFGSNNLDIDLSNLSTFVLGFANVALCVCVISPMASVRGKILPACLFLLLWAILVLDVINYWISNVNGWAHKLGVINASGGGPNLAMGTTALVYSWYIGKRKFIDNTPHSKMLAFIGTVGIWIGWNAISCIISPSFNKRTLLSLINVNLAGLSGGFAWTLVSYYTDKNQTRKLSIFSFCIGAIGGFLGVATSLNRIGFLSAVIMGIIGSLISNFSPVIAKLLRTDDHINLFAFQGMGSLSSLLMAPFFVQTNIYGLKDLDNEIQNIFSGNFLQIFKQLAFAFACIFWAFAISLILLISMDKILRLKLRVTEKQEDMGLDLACLGESGYYFVDSDINNNNVSVMNNECNTKGSSLPSSVNKNTKIILDDKMSNDQC